LFADTSDGLDGNIRLCITRMKKTSFEFFVVILY
jgi:hypothetical protein